MDDNKKLFEAALLLKESCEKKRGFPFQECDCLFYKNGCLLIEHPKYWKITEPCKWTENDYNLAKALKGFGAVTIFRTLGDNIVWLDETGIYKSENTLPQKSFSSIKLDEVYSLEQIIKEYDAWSKT